jgi:GAF domain-containing protein
MNKAAQQRAAVRRLTGALAGQSHIREYNQVVVEEALRLTGASTAALCLLIDGDERMDFVAAAGDKAQQILGLRIRIADSVAERAIASGAALMLDSSELAQTGDLFAASDDGAHGLSDRTGTGNAALRSAAVAPIKAAGRAIGTLIVQNKTGGEAGAVFDEGDLDSLAMLAEFAALGRETAQNTARACDQSRELAVLYHAAQTVAGNLNVQQVLESVLAALCSHIEYHSAVLLLLNDERTHLFIAAERGLSEDDREIQFSVESPPYAHCLSSGEARIGSLTGAADEAAEDAERMPALSTIIAPIKSRHDIHGLLQVTSLQRDAYDDGDLRMAAAVGMQAGIAIENAWLYEDAQRQAEQSTALYELSQHVNGTLNLDSVLTFVADSAMKLLNVEKFALLLVDRDNERLTPRLCRGIDAAAFQGYRPGIGEGIPGWVYEWQTPQAVANVSADPRDHGAALERFGVASVLCVPMHVNDDVIGILMAMTSRRRLFTVGEMELLYTISNQAAVAIFNALQYRLARTRSHEMSRYFRRIAHALGSSFDGNLPQVISDLAVEIMRADRCAIYVQRAEQLHLSASSRFRAGSTPESTVQIGHGLAGWVARRGQSLVLTDVHDDGRAKGSAAVHRDHLASYLGLPLKAERRIAGVIEIYSQQPREFTREEVQLLSTFVRRARLAERLLEVAQTAAG